MAASLTTQFPWTASPLIANAPMGGFAGGRLAAAVTTAKGLGFIGAIGASDLKKELEIASKELGKSRSEDPSSTARRQDTPTLLPIGVGLLAFIIDIATILPILAEYQPAIVWLFAAKDIADYTPLATEIRKVCPHSKIWIQVGTVSGAVAIAQSARPDALILQGSDAGGHGFERGASIVSLLPETLDTLASKGLDHIPILASGGIVDARGAAAAAALGASGVVMGTRFLAAPETVVPHQGYRDLVLSTRDGSVNTVRSKLFDNVKGPNIWPHDYDGRSLVTTSYEDFVGGVDMDEVRRRHNAAAKGDDKGFGPSNRANVWAGAGVGLVNQMQGAGEIMDEVRAGIKSVLQQAMARL